MKSNELKNTLIAGIFVSVSAFIGMFIIFALGKESNMFEKKVHVYTEVTNAKNLKLGAAVQLKGITIGKVEEMNFIKVDRIRIKMLIVNDYLNWIKKDSYVDLKTQGMLGDKFIEILGGKDESPNISEGDTINFENSFEVAEFINKSDALLVKTTEVLTRIDNFLTDINKNHQIYDTLSNINKASKSMQTFSSDLEKSKMFAKFDQAANQLLQVSSRIQSGPGTLHSLIYDNSIHEDLRALVGGAQRSSVLKYFIRETIKKSEK
ncbi:MAG: MlaD family protein [Bacteriovoracaceae bacterium]